MIDAARAAFISFRGDALEGDVAAPLDGLSPFRYLQVRERLRDRVRVRWAAFAAVIAFRLRRLAEVSRFRATLTLGTAVRFVVAIRTLPPGPGWSPAAGSGCRSGS